MMHRRKRLRLESESQPEGPTLDTDSQETVEFEKEPSPQPERLQPIQYASENEPPVMFQNVESPVKALPQNEQLASPIKAVQSFESPVKRLQNQYQSPVKSLHEFENSPTVGLSFQPEVPPESPDPIFEAAERSSFLPDIERDSENSPPDSPVLPLEDIKNEPGTKTVSHPRAELIEQGDERYVKLFNSDGTYKLYELKHKL